MKKFRFYVPGMLSLTLLFPMAMYKLAKSPALQKQYVLEVNWFDPKLASRYGSMPFPPFREYSVFNLTGHPVDDARKIGQAKVLIKEIMEHFDTMRGARIHFADTSKYESFVSVLSFCGTIEGLAFAPYKSDIWIFNRGH